MKALVCREVRNYRGGREMQAAWPNVLVLD